jgi:ATP-dependent Lon protease
MLSDVLETHRQFCIGNPMNWLDPDFDEKSISEISVAGLVRACVAHQDGTSHLMLLGRQRIRITGWTQLTPYRIAAIEPIEPEPEDMTTARQLANEVIRLSDELTGDGHPMSERLHEHLEQVDDPGAVADVVAHAYVRDPDHRRQLVETISPLERLHFLTRHLQDQIADQA